MVGANNPQESTQASREILAYVRKLLGPTRAGSVVGGTPNLRLPIPQSGGTGQQALTNGERASGSPRQLQAEAITKPSKSSSGSSGGFNIGNDWLLSPIAGVLNSVLVIFGMDVQDRAVLAAQAVSIPATTGCYRRSQEFSIRSWVYSGSGVPPRR